MLCWVLVFRLAGSAVSVHRLPADRASYRATPGIDRIRHIELAGSRWIGSEGDPSTFAQRNGEHDTNLAVVVREGKLATQRDVGFSTEGDAGDGAVRGRDRDLSVGHAAARVAQASADIARYGDIAAAGALHG